MVDHGHDDDGTPPRPRGSFRVQAAETSSPRPPTAAEARLREKARKAREAAEEIARAKKRARKRRAKVAKTALMGTVAVAGAAGVIGMGHVCLSAAFDNEPSVAATCVNIGPQEHVRGQGQDGRHG